MYEKKLYDITSISFDGFVEFLFRSKIEGEHKKFWYWESEIVYDEQEIVAHYIRLFTDPAFLLEKFPAPVLDGAFWAIQVQNLDCSANRIIGTRDLLFATRETCVRSMFHLFERLFSLNPLEIASFMWWDSLCYDWHCGIRSRDRGGEDMIMQDVMFETVSKILALESPDCQKAALHGLGHLHHPSTKPVIVDYLKRNPTLSEELHTYALSASNFEVQ